MFVLVWQNIGAMQLIALVQKKVLRVNSFGLHKIMAEGARWQNIPIKTFAYLNLWSLCSQREGSRQLCTLLAQCGDRWGGDKIRNFTPGAPIKRYQLKHSLQVVSQHSLGKLRPNLSVTNNQTNDRKVQTQLQPPFLSLLVWSRLSKQHLKGRLELQLLQFLGLQCHSKTITMYLCEVCEVGRTKKQCFCQVCISIWQFLWKVVKKTGIILAIFSNPGSSLHSLGG